MKDNNGLDCKIKLLKAQRDVKVKELELKRSEISAINKELLDIEFVEISWQELETWLKENRPENNYEKNPLITNIYHTTSTYCLINKDGELQIGPYYHNDNFPRGTSLLVTYDFKSYRD